MGLSRVGGINGSIRSSGSAPCSFAISHIHIYIRKFNLQNHGAPAEIIPNPAHLCVCPLTTRASRAAPAPKPCSHLFHVSSPSPLHLVVSLPRAASVPLGA